MIPPTQDLTQLLADYGEQHSILRVQDLSKLSGEQRAVYVVACDAFAHAIAATVWPKDLTDTANTLLGEFLWLREVAILLQEQEDRA